MKMDERKLTNQEIIALMDVYLSELNRRDQSFFMQAFRYFYAVIVVILLPYLPFITPLLQNNPFSFYKLIFHISGFIMTLIFGYVLWGYAIRFYSSAKTYQATYEKLDQEYWRKELKDIRFGKYFTTKMIYIVVATMFLSLLGINILLFLTTR
jgi:hypothetical protein